MKLPTKGIKMLAFQEVRLRDLKEVLGALNSILKMEIWMTLVIFLMTCLEEALRAVALKIVALIRGQEALIAQALEETPGLALTGALT